MRLTISTVLVALVLGMTPTGCARHKVVEPAGSTEYWTFVIFGDTRGDFDPAKEPPYNTSTATGVSLLLPQVAAKIASLKPDFVLHVGDMICGDLYEDVIAMGVPNVVPIPYADQLLASKAALSAIYSADIPIYTVRGSSAEWPVVSPLSTCWARTERSSTRWDMYMT